MATSPDPFRESSDIAVRNIQYYSREFPYRLCVGPPHTRPLRAHRFGEGDLLGGAESPTSPPKESGVDATGTTAGEGLLDKILGDAPGPAPAPAESA